MSAFTIDQLVTLTEILVILMGIAIVWVVFYNSDRAELPGQATNPDPGTPEDIEVDNRGRTL